MKSFLLENIIYEFFGSFFLILTNSLVGLNKSDTKPYSYIEEPLSVFLIYILFYSLINKDNIITLNPLVTLSLLALKKIKISKAISDIIIQIFGGLIAISFIKTFFHSSNIDNDNIFGFDYWKPKNNLLFSFFIEVINSFIFNIFFLIFLLKFKYKITHICIFLLSLYSSLMLYFFINKTESFGNILKIICPIIISSKYENFVFYIYILGQILGYGLSLLFVFIFTIKKRKLANKYLKKVEEVEINEKPMEKELLESIQEEQEMENSYVSEINILKKRNELLESEKNIN